MSAQTRGRLSFDGMDESLRRRFRDESRPLLAASDRAFAAAFGRVDAGVRRPFPALKRWATFNRPCGAQTKQPRSRKLENGALLRSYIHSSKLKGAINQNGAVFFCRKFNELGEIGAVGGLDKKSVASG